MNVTLFTPKPLDIVLFKGQQFASNLIVKVESIVDTNATTLSEGMYSHVGVVVTRDIFPFIKTKIPMDPSKLYVLETTCSGWIAGDETPDVATGKCRFGVQIRELDLVLKTYVGKIAILPLRNNPSVKKNDETQDDYTKRLEFVVMGAQSFWASYDDVMYEMNPLLLLSSAFHFLRVFKVLFPISSQWQMCSSLITSFYKCLGVFPLSVETDMVMPEDFIFDEDHQVASAKLFVHPPIVIKPAL
jgi:hypothetical protein